VSLTESPTKIEENCIFRAFKQKFTTGSYRVGIKRAWCCRKAWEKSGSRVPKINKTIKKILLLEAVQITNDQNLVSRNFRG
jgi:hypothetical protein